MIFTTLPGSIETQSADEAVRALANHIRILQEELEYRLSVLDSSNIASIDATVTPIVTEDGNLLSVLKDDGRYSQLEQTVDGLRTEVQRCGGDIETQGMALSSLTQTAESLRTEVTRYGGQLETYGQQISAFTQTADTVSTMVTSIGKDGVVTAATVAAKIADDQSLIALIADNVDITGVTTIRSTGIFDDGTRAIEIDNGFLHFLDEWDQGIAGITATRGDEGLWISSNYGINLTDYATGSDTGINIESESLVYLGSLTDNVAVYANDSAFISADEIVDITAGEEIRLYGEVYIDVCSWTFKSDGLYDRKGNKIL